MLVSMFNSGTHTWNPVQTLHWGSMLDGGEDQLACGRADEHHVAGLAPAGQHVSCAGLPCHGRHPARYAIPQQSVAGRLGLILQHLS